MYPPLIFLFTVVTIILIVVAYRMGKKSSLCRKRISSQDKNLRTTIIRSHKDSSLQCIVVILEKYTLDDALDYFKKRSRKNQAFDRLRELYDLERSFPDLSVFRLGPNMFNKITLDWIICYLPDTKVLVGHGITTRIAWDQDKEHLPDGWQGAVRTSYLNSSIERKQSNTLVGLFIFIEKGFRKQGWADNIIEEMRNLSQLSGLQSLIIPLRPPLRYQKQYAAMPMSEFALLKREDGLPEDHWIRLHVRSGASILGVSETSHRHAMSLQDFYEQFSHSPVTHSGDTMIEKNGEWFKIYVGLEHDVVLINQGCVWVQHTL